MTDLICTGCAFTVRRITVIVKILLGLLTILMISLPLTSSLLVRQKYTDFSDSPNVPDFTQIVVEPYFSNSEDQTSK